MNIQEVHENMTILKGDMYSLQSSYRNIATQIKNANMKLDIQTRKVDFTLSRLINLKK